MHFTVAVITNEFEDVDNMLERFDETLQIEKELSMTRDEAVESGRSEPGHEGWSDEDCWKYTFDRYYGDDELKDENGNLYYWTNPEAKWDWYEIGGRWENTVVTKDGEKVNSAKIGEIDFDKTPITSAVVTQDGEWHEEGWSEDEKATWDEEWYDRFISTSSTNWTLTIVDCHC